MIVLDDFEQLYVSLRRKENRLYSDEQVKWLPEIDLTHHHYKEWVVRRQSCNRLIEYFTLKKRDLNLLEAGCGNGWLSARLSKIPGSNVAGIDVNNTELDQAKRVFGEIESLEFFSGSLKNHPFENEKFDAVIFAASIQYFPSLRDAIDQALRLVVPGGEVHILDSFFYKKEELEAARRGSAEYYKSLGFPQMSGHYFHHSLSELQGFDLKVLYNPGFFLNRFHKNRNPFYWICITHHD